MLIGILVIIGWFTHNDFLRTIVPGQVKMKFNVALAFVFSSIVLLLEYFPGKNKTQHPVSIFLSVLISLIGLLTLIEYIFGFNIGIDELFVKDELRTTTIYYAGRMSPLSAVNFLLIGTGLFLLNKEKTATYQFYYLSSIAFIALLMLIGFNFISDIPTYIRLAIHVAICFITLPVAIWFAQPAMQKKISFERKLFTGFTAVIILMLALGIFSSYYSDKRITTAKLVEHTNNVLHEAEQTLSITKDLESGSRGYIITGDSDYLEPFTMAKDTLFGHLKKLKELTADNFVQQVRTDSLSALVGKRISFSLQSIVLRNEKGVESASKMIATRLGKSYMERIRNLIFQIQQEESNLLAQRQNENNKSIVSFNRAFFVFLAGVLILLIIIPFSIRNNILLRKRAAEKLKEFEHFFNNSNDLSCIANTEGYFEILNPSFEKVLGHSQNELSENPFLDFVHPDDISATLHEYAKLKSGALVIHFFNRYRKKDGSYLWFDWNATPNAVTGKLYCIARDITDRKKAEDALSKLNEELEQRVIERTEEVVKSERRFRALIENSNDIISLLDESFKVFYRSPSAFRIMGWTDEEMIDSDGTKNIHPDDRETAGNIVKELMNNPGKPINCLFRNMHRNGHYLWMEGVVINLLQDEYIKAIVFNFRDVTERKKAEETLRASEARFRRIFDANIVGFLLWDKNGDILEANDHFLSMVGYTKKDLSENKISWKDMTSPEYAHLDMEALEQIRLTGVSQPFEKEYLRKDGSSIPIIIWAASLEGDSPDKGIAYVLDISERKKTEGEILRLNVDLVKNERKFRGLIENSYDMVSIINEKFKTLYRSPSAYRITGWRDEDMEETDRMELTHPDDIPALKVMMSDILANPGKPFTISFRSKHKDGYYIWVDGVTTNMLHDESIKGIVANFRDVTESKEAEEKLIKSEKIYKTIAASIPGSVICLLDRDFRYLLLEGDMLEKLGYSKNKLLGNKAEDVLSPEIFAGVQKDFIRVLEGETVTRESRSFGYDTISRFIPLKDENNIVYAIMTVAIDVTKLKNAQRDIGKLNRDLEGKIIQRTAQLESVNKELESFSYSVSHDLRAPLRIIHGFGQILIEDYSPKLDEEGRHTVDVIMNSASKMGQLIDDLLNFSKWGRSEMRMAEVNMNELVEEVLQELKNSGISIPTKLKQNKLKTANGDNNLLKQVWVNLISNAIKYSGAKKDPIIEIGMMGKKGQPVYYVKDNGAGFDMQYAGNLFGVFQRFHKEGEFSGTGVGLALVQRIVVRHGGTIWAEAKVNEGATFYFALPE